MILVGAGAQVVYTKQPRPTDFDMVGRITPRDIQVIKDALLDALLKDAGFERRGRHWLHAWTLEGVLVEVPDSVLMGEDPPELIEVGGHELRVISVDDLMMDRLVQATDRTDITWDEVISLARTVHRDVNWDRIGEWCMTKRTEDLGLHILPQVLEEVLADVAATRQRRRETPGSTSTSI